MTRHYLLPILCGKGDDVDNKSLVQSVASDPAGILMPYGSGAILNQDVLTVEAIPDSCVDLIVTSPPYNLDINYGSYDDSVDRSGYFDWMRDCFALFYRWLKPDGRMCLNVPITVTKNGHRAIGMELHNICKELGFQYTTTIIWNNGNMTKRTAWGSWKSASAPYVIPPVELIIVLYKDSWKKLSKGESDIERDEFIEWTYGVWEMTSAKRSQVGHPAPFPIELPTRCIKLFSYVGDVVLDPFLGSGTTLISAIQNRRHGLGVEIDFDYCRLAIDRLQSSPVELLG